MFDAMTRREAMQFLSVSMAGLSLGGYTSTAFGYAKNETLNIGLIGCGGRLRGALLAGLEGVPGVNVTAICDVYSKNLDATNKRLAELKSLSKSKDIFQTGDHRALLDRPDVDAVIIATPDHWHVPITIDAIEAGKHVYVEKPVSHDVEEGKKLVEVKQRHPKVAVQVGAQQRTMPHIQVLKKKLDAGEINLGPIHRIHMQWHRNQRRPFEYVVPKINPADVDWKRFLGNAPDQPFDAYKMANWRWFWDFGNSMLGDLMVHWLDATNYLLNLPLPGQIVAVGGSYLAGDKREAPDVMQAVLDYPNEKIQADFSHNLTNNDRKACTIIEGLNATLYFDRGRYEVTQQLNNDQEPGEILDSNVVGEGPKGKDFYSSYNGETLHLADWTAAIREGREPLDTVEAAVQAATTAQYGNISYREKRIVQIP
jgi:predicted dehydrogenase